MGYFTNPECGGTQYFDRFRNPTGLARLTCDLTLYAGWSDDDPDRRIAQVTEVTVGSLANGANLTSGRVYHFTETVTFDGNLDQHEASSAALKLDAGTTVFYIDKGVKVTCTGSDGGNGGDGSLPKYDGKDRPAAGAGGGSGSCHTDADKSDTFPYVWYGPSGVRMKSSYDYVSETDNGDVYLELIIRRTDTVAIRITGDGERTEYTSLTEEVEEVQYGETIAVVGDVTEEQAKVPSGTLVLDMPRGDFRVPAQKDLRHPDYDMVVSLGKPVGQESEAYYYTIDPNRVRVRFVPVDANGAAVVLTPDESGAVLSAALKMENIKDDLYYTLDRTDDLSAGWTSGTKTQYDTDGTGIYETSVELMGNPSAQLFRVRVTDNPLGAIPSGSAQ